MSFHRRERTVATLAALLGVRIFVEPAEHRPVADDGDVRLVLVLLEEHPLQDLRALVGLGGEVLVPSARYHMIAFDSAR